MSIPAMIKRNAKAVEGQDQTLADSQFSCTYRELPGLLDGIDRYLQEQGVDFAGIPALECINSLAGALTLLSLFYKGRSFLLLPGSGDAEHGLDSKPVSSFCPWRIAVRRAPPDGPSSWLDTPERFLAVTQNPGHAGAPVELADAKARLYLRTSGSMGAAKIVVHEHGQLIGNARNCLERFGLEAADRVTLPVPIFHMYGLGAGFLPALAAGASIHVEDNSNILRYLETERRFRPNVAFLNPLLCDMLLRGRRSKGGYRRVVTSTQRIKEETFRAFEERFGGLVSLYGSTEMGAVAACRADDPLEQRLSTLGRPLSGVELRMAEPDAACSELLCRHPYGYLGYLDDAGQWLYRTAPSDWYRTGDLVEAIPPEGFAVKGRANDSINRSGYLVMLNDIENAMEKLADLTQVAVVAADHREDQRGPRLTAFCAIKRNAVLDAAGIRAACFELLPHYAIPDRVVVIDALPLLPSGKVDRQALAAHAVQA